MASKTFKVVIGAVAVLAVSGTMAAVRLDNASLRRRVAALKGERQHAARLHDDNRQLQEIVARSATDADDGARSIHADLLRARTEVEELEREARASRAHLRSEATQDAENLATNRDPQKGLVRLEHFQNQGQTTPATAFQTFVWAAMKGEDATLADMITMDSAAREKGLAVIAALPEETRAKYSTPEKLAALFFAAALTGQPSAQIVDVSRSDSQHAIIQVRGLTDRVQKVPMQLGPQGWQIVVPEKMAENLGRWALGRTSSPDR